jgi:hypothetical protein
MARKLYKEIEKDGSKITIWGSNRKIKLRWGVPDWEIKDNSPRPRGEELEQLKQQYFIYEGHRHYLSEFCPTPKDSFLDEFDGYANDSFFSGVCFKWVRNERGEIEDEAEVRAYTFCS